MHKNIYLTIEKIEKDIITNIYFIAKKLDDILLIIYTINSEINS